MTPGHRKIASVIVLAAAGLPAFAQTAVLGKTGANGAISFVAIEDLLIGGNRKVRLMPEKTQTLDPATFKKLQRMDLPQAGLLRISETGQIVRLTEKGAPREVILSDNMQVKSPVPGKSAQGRLAIEVVTSKKAKQRDPLAQENFFMYTASDEPDEAVLDFINEEWAFRDLDERFRAMKGLVASFPTAGATKALRAQLERRVAQGTAAFDDGGPFDDLLTTSRYATVASEAFPKDDRLATLRAGVEQRIHFVRDSIAMLRSLGISGYWDAFLDLYPKFEPYQWSFSDLQALRVRALEESSRVHADRARGFATRGNHEASIREFVFALRRDPANQTLLTSRDAEQLLSAQGEARKTAAGRKRLTPDSPEGVRFDRALFNADRAIQDKDFGKAKQQISEAEIENKDAPQIVLAQAHLVAAQGRLRAALDLLDQYDRMASDAAERSAGAKLRNEVLYDLPAKKDAARKAVAEALTKGDYPQAAHALTGILEADDRDPDLLYLDGTISAVMRGADARSTLERYLDLSDNLAGDMKRRDTARRAIAILDHPLPRPAAGAANWMSGRKLAPGVYYCPESLAFQVPITSVAGFKMKMTFDWKQGKLNTISTAFEDDKGHQNYVALNSTPAPAGEVGNFYFDYLPEGPLRAIHMKKPAQPAADGFHLVRENGGAHLVDNEGEPRLLFPGDPKVNPAVMGLLESPVFLLASGNSYFNPFIWDGVHYFTATYDERGRVDSARELGADNLVRFTWEDERLTEIRAYRKNSDSPYYRRAINYSGQKIVSEEYTGGGKGGQIKYVVNGGETEARIDDHGTHDGHSWVAHLGGN